ncbi:MAG: PhoU domain-containing protein [Acidimicrobiales bacterium]
MDDALELIDRKVLQLFTLVGESMAGATHALLSGDREVAKALADGDAVVDQLYHDIEELGLEQLTVAGIGAALAPPGRPLETPLPRTGRQSSHPSPPRRGEPGPGPVEAGFGSPA